MLQTISIVHERLYHRGDRLHRRSGPPMSFIEAIDLCERISVKEAPRLRILPVLLKLSADVMDIVGGLVNAPEPYATETLRFNARTTYLGSDAKAQRNPDFTTWPFGKGLRETLRREMQHLGMPIPEL